jgi:hypothetical protein
MLLRQEIVRWVGPDPVSFLEFWATFTDEVQIAGTTLEKSIYAGVSLRESPGMWFAGIGRSFRLAGHVVGTDKLGHFFMQGLGYYKRVEEEGAELEHVLQYEHGEDGVWGLKTSGVKSYADMAANYGGFRFWSELYQGARPYARCEDGRRWVKARQFTWNDYVTDAWDEAINCSEFKAGLDERVRANLAKAGMSCPVKPIKCVELAGLDKAEFVVSPACRALAMLKGVPAGRSMGAVGPTPSTKPRPASVAAADPTMPVPKVFRR